MPWIFNEDAALKAKLQGLTVTDTNAPTGGRPVLVRFRLPEGELGDLKFPAIIIEHASISKADEREHRGFIKIPYAPEGLELWDDPNLPLDSLDPRLSPYQAEFPIPYDLDYLVTVHTRNYQHLIQLVGALAQHDRIPARFGALAIPQDGTARRVDIIGGPDMSNDFDDNGKRLFRGTYRLRVSTELLQTQVQTYYTVTSLVGTIVDRNTGAEVAEFWNTYDGQPPEPITP